VCAAEVALCAVGPGMHRRLLGQGYRDRLISAVQAPAVEPDELLAVRAAGDEASGLLVAGQFVGWMSAVLSRLLTNLWFWACIILGVQLSVLLSIWLSSGFRLAFAMLSVFVFVGLAVVAAIAVMLGAALGFGADGPFLAMFAATSAEAAPPGRATLLQLQPFPKDTGKGLAHSKLYDDKHVIASIVDAVRGSTPGPGDDQGSMTEHARDPAAVPEARRPSAGETPAKRRRKRA
jgi:hypothetical protein